MGSKWVRLGTAVLVVLLLVPAGGCASAETVFPASTNGVSAAAAENNMSVLKVGLCSPVGVLDPALADTRPELLLANALFSKLVDIREGTVVPELARSWSFSEDGKELTIKLRQDAKFDNGDMLTAKDVEFSLERLASPGLASPYAPLLAAAVGTGPKQAADAITAPDDYTVVIKLQKPRKDFVELLALPGFSIVDSGAAAIDAAFGHSGTYFSPAEPVVGSGPFKLVEWVNGQGLTLEANPDFFGDVPALERVEFYIYDDALEAANDFCAGDLDVLYPDSGVKRAAEQYPALKAKLSSIPSDTFYYLGFNNSVPPFNNVETRQAVNMALDRSVIARIAGNAVLPLQGLLPQGIFPAGAPPVQYDPTAARWSLGVPGPGGESKFPAVSLSAPADEVSDAIAQEIVRELGDVGIKVRLQTSQTGIPDLNCNLALVRWTMPVSIPGALYPYFEVRGDYFLCQYGGISVPAEVDEAAADSSMIGYYLYIDRQMVSQGTLIGLVQDQISCATQDRVKKEINENDGLLDLQHTAVEKE